MEKPVPMVLVQDGKLYCKTCKEVAVIRQSESASCLRIEKQWVDVGVQGGNVRGKERKKNERKNFASFTVQISCYRCKGIGGAKPK